MHVTTRRIAASGVENEGCPGQMRKDFGRPIFDKKEVFRPGLSQSRLTLINAIKSEDFKIVNQAVTVRRALPWSPNKLFYKCHLVIFHVFTAFCS